MKRITAVLAIVVLTLTTLPMMVFAHGHNAGGSSNTRYSPCNVESCNITGVHQHGNAYYSGHSLNDGHKNHEVCPVVQGCAKTDAHTHDESVYFAHHNGDGHAYHNNSDYNSRHDGGRHH